MGEKFEAVVHAVVNNHIPDDLVFSILSKLPIKSLKRFGCICKSWSLLLENPYFMSMFRNNFTDTSLLLKQDFRGEEYHSLLYLLSGERFENRARLDFPPSFPRNALSFRVIGSSVNGILCLHYGNDRVLLWNPATREFKVVPSNPVKFKSLFECLWLDYMGFGYDHVRDDYKVIQYVKFSILYKEELEPLWEIYSLRSDSWKKLDCKGPTYFYYSNNDVRLYTDGWCHWWGTDENLHVSRLVSFDLSNEVFFSTPVPSYMGDRSFYYYLLQVRLAVINGSVALISNNLKRNTIEVLILGEVGVKESWTKLFTIGPFPCIVNPIGVWMKGYILFEKDNHELAWFDWSTYMVVDLGIKMLHCEIFTYKENFESLISAGFEK